MPKVSEKKVVKKVVSKSTSPSIGKTEKKIPEKKLIEKKSSEKKIVKKTQTAQEIQDAQVLKSDELGS